MTWAQQAERGAPLLIRVALWAALHGGRYIAPVLIWPSVAWFFAMSPTGRATSRDYLRRVLCRPVRERDVVRHFHAFAHAVLDRALLLAGRADRFKVKTEGLAHVLTVLGGNQGCILLGAHLGSFEVLRALARHAPVPVWALMYRRNAGALTALLDRITPSMRAQVIEIGDTASMIRARECVERGEIVGILADRAPPGHRMTVVPFLGAPAAFPTGPFVLASTLAAPVILFTAVRTGPGAYLVRFEPFTDRLVLPRASREAGLVEAVGRYARAIEVACRAHPFQWFNFFPFWDTSIHAAQSPAQAAPPVGSAHVPAFADTPGRSADRRR